MGSTITARVSDEVRRELEKITESEKLDRSTVVRRLLEQAIWDYKLDEALKRYQSREVSLGKAAEEAGISLRKVLSEARKRDVHFDYTKESLREDVRVEDE
ncbi:hypothetical protein AKJ57_00725 [candidate division MSBL1 archaeon SCGC-AAA259A05]|uniref:Ribbon-helix-helix protein CopG domain-containing protein n=1 Tax=candidate division MSBL1 archaeon SCGC-AAA259A05 TaxID=1698259 RepID=A0A133UBK7_9EURY|nr:hypothetical protein AKJ57_00725 [candidate division MSBL1 archaeon SCGC-AAA259A05]